MKIPNYKHIKFSYLEDNFGHEITFWNEIIDTALEDIPKLQHTLSQSLQSQDYHELAEAAHQLKGMVQVFGLAELSKQLKQMQLDAQTQTNTNSLAKRIDQVASALKPALVELADFQSRFK